MENFQHSSGPSKTSPSKEKPTATSTTQTSLFGEVHNALVSEPAETALKSEATQPSSSEVLPSRTVQKRSSRTKSKATARDVTPKPGSFSSELLANEDDAVKDGIGPLVWSVSQLTAHIQACFDHDPLLGGAIIVQGEISNLKRSSRGHVYFTLKDGTASVSAILWAGQASKLLFQLTEGLEVFITGKLQLYAPSGSYSLITQKMEPVGVGALQLAFQQLKDRLEAEGLFEAEAKQPLPEFPLRIGIVTSRTGAVIHDMLRVIRRKNWMVDVLLAPVKVQGEGAAHEIAMAIQHLNLPDYQLDLIIVARGGGSFEDLFCFSEEPVVRAIAQSEVPIIAGIGHEPDYGLADAAADISASTPTAAAELAIPDLHQIGQELTTLKDFFARQLDRLVNQHEQRLDYLSQNLLSGHARCLQTMACTIERSQEQLAREVQRTLERSHFQLTQFAESLENLSPLKTLARGYSVVQNSATGEVVFSVKQLVPGEKIIVRFEKGTAHCEVLTLYDHSEHAKD